MEYEGMTIRRIAELPSVGENNYSRFLLSGRIQNSYFRFFLLSRRFHLPARSSLCESTDCSRTTVGQRVGVNASPQRINS